MGFEENRAVIRSNSGEVEDFTIREKVNPVRSCVGPIYTRPNNMIVISPIGPGEGGQYSLNLRGHNSLKRN